MVLGGGERGVAAGTMGGGAAAMLRMMLALATAAVLTPPPLPPAPPLTTPPSGCTPTGPLNAETRTLRAAEWTSLTPTMVMPLTIGESATEEELITPLPKRAGSGHRRLIRRMPTDNGSRRRVKIR